MPSTSPMLLTLRNKAPLCGRLLHGTSRNQLERLEPRAMLSAAPIQFGAVYVEHDLGSDANADTIEVSFVGGAADTELARLEINGDKLPAGLSLADLIFDTDRSGLGADLSHNGTIVSRRGDFEVEILVQDGSSQLVLLLDGFQAGDKLTLAIDVDEVQGFDANQSNLQLINEDLDPIASGAEFQSSQMTAYFTAPHHHDAQGEAEFRNRYDENLNQTSLELPRDDAGGSRDRTAGAVGELVQTPLPISIAGRVYEDMDGNLRLDENDPGIVDVSLALYQERAGSIVFTGHTTITGSLGDYSFDTSLGLLPGNYEIRESQPDGFFSVGAEIGTVDGAPSGIVASPDILSGISIPFGGQAAQNYDFAEARPISVRGRVHLSSPDGDCWDESVLHEPVSGATVLLFNESGESISRTVTDKDGRYEFRGLRPGEYAIVEVTPGQLVAGSSRAGQVRGRAEGIAGFSEIEEIHLQSGDEGTYFDFCDHEPATLSGHVYHDRNNDGDRDVGEEGIAQAVLSILDELGKNVATVESDSSGRYEFVGLRAGNYRVVQLQPDGWLDGTDRAGSANGRRTGQAINPGDTIEAIDLKWGDRAVDFDFGELLPSSLQGQVHLSSPGGDCWSVDEGVLEPIAGALVQLFDATGEVLAETRTDAAGNYVFEDLVPGEYTVREFTPTQLVDGGARAGWVEGVQKGEVSVQGDIFGIHLGSDESGVSYDFCEHRPAVLSGYVFVDGDHDGQRGATDTPIGGVIVQLYDATNNLVAETRTDPQGQYTFRDLHAGTYLLRQIHPTGYIDGLDFAGTVDGIQVGTAMNPGDEIREIQIGWNQVGAEYNFSETLPKIDPDFPPPTNPPARPPGPSVPTLPQPELYRTTRWIPPVPLQDIPIQHDGSHSGTANTWHLSIIDGGQPRVSLNDAESGLMFPASAWHHRRMASGKWELANSAGEDVQIFYFGLKDSFPITGDFNGDGTTEIGVFSKGHWFIDLNGNGRWDSSDLWAKLGHEGDTPVVGDWDGDGKDDIGVFGKAWPGDSVALRTEHGLPDLDNVPSGARKNMPPTEDVESIGRRIMRRTAQGKLREDVIDHVFLFGSRGDTGVVGDWNGDGIDTVGVFRAGTWRLDVDGNGRWSGPDELAQFGGQQDIPLVGDFNGDGIDELAIIRNGKIYIDSNGNRRLDVDDLVINYDAKKGFPVVGKWDQQVGISLGTFIPIDGDAVMVANRYETE